MATIECACPPTPAGDVRHPDGDLVTLRERLDFRSSLTARNAIVVLKSEDADASPGEILAALTETYLLVGIESWTLVDARGKPVPVSKAAIRVLMEEHQESAMAIGDEADGLYNEAVIGPLVRKASSSSPPTPIGASTSATGGGSPPRKRSRPSSTSTTPMAATERMSASPAGGSSSSRS